SDIGAAALLRILGGRRRFDLDRNLTADLDFNLPVTHFPDDSPGRADQQTSADIERAFEQAAHLDGADLDGALQDAAFHDRDILARQIGRDAALDDELIAMGDVALQRNLAPDRQLAQFGL